MARKKRSPKTVVGHKKKICILGTTPSRMQGPINDPEWEIWTIGPGGMDAHRWDILFEVHGVWPENFKDYLKTLSEIKPPQIVVTLDDPRRLIHKWTVDNSDSVEKQVELEKHISGDWAASMVLPKRDLTEKYMRRMWFSSSISYCIAYAIEQKPTDLGLFGIDLESGEEYIAQFTGCAHFIDLARLAGINVHLPSGCGLDRDVNPYPDRYETNLALTLEKKHAWLSHAISQQEADYANILADLNRQEGAILAMRSMKAPEEDLKKAEQRLAEINAEQARIGANVNHLKGELSATQFYRRMYVWNVVDP